MELLVVVLIMSLSLGLYLGYNFRQRDAILIRATAREVQQWMRASRSHALLEGKVNVGAYHVRDHLLAADLRRSTVHLSRALEVVLAEGESRDVVPVACFYADGSAEPSRLVLRLEDHEAAVLVDPVLGEVSLAW